MPPLCQHPNLPGQVVQMAHPRNGWEPLTDEQQQQQAAAAAKKKTPRRRKPKQGSPTAGSPTTTQDQE